MKNRLYPDMPILLVDDEEHFLKSASFILKSDGINNIVLCSKSKEVLQILSEKHFSLIILDLIMPEIPGEILLEKINKEYPDVPILILTAEMKLEKAIECIKKGAYDYLVKPINKNKLLTVIKNIIRLNEIKNENKLLKEQIVKNHDLENNFFNEIITKNEIMKSIFQYTYAIAKTALPILITGETGTGKELLAKSVHSISNRKGKFVAINIAGVDHNLISDTLFGHKKGSYTGSVESRKGLIEQASDGTLFLDEIGDLDSNSQIKLLRVLQERKYYPIGSDNEEIIDVRFIFATNQNIDDLIKENKLRKDLYYRLQSHHIHLPPLRKRLDDIPILVEYLLSKAADMLNKRKPTYPKELITLLQNYNFPGNIREIEGMIFDAVGRYEKGILSLKSFKDKIGYNVKKKESEKSSYTDDTSISKILDSNESNFLTLKEMEKAWIEKALKKSNGNQTIAAKLLGMSRRALNNRLSRKKKKSN